MMKNIKNNLKIGGVFIACFGIFSVMCTTSAQAAASAFTSFERGMLSKGTRIIHSLMQPVHLSSRGISGVKVIAADPPLVPAPEFKVAWTFDDGPSPFPPSLLALRDTPSILAILASPFPKSIPGNGSKPGIVRSTFFQVGANVSANPSLSRYALNAGHILGNHTQTHPWNQQGMGLCILGSMDKIYSDIKTAQKTFQDSVNSPYDLQNAPRFFRCPQGYYSCSFGDLTDPTMTGSPFAQLGIAQVDITSFGHYYHVGWSVDDYSWDDSTTPDRISSLQLGRIGSNSDTIILSHDSHLNNNLSQGMIKTFAALDYLGNIIVDGVNKDVWQYGSGKPFEFVTVGQFFDLHSKLRCIPVGSSTATCSYLTLGQSLYSPACNYVLSMQRDFNLVLYEMNPITWVRGRPIWATGTNDPEPLVAGIKLDNNGLQLMTSGWGSPVKSWAVDPGRICAELRVTDKPSIELVDSNGSVLTTIWPSVLKFGNSLTP